MNKADGDSDASPVGAKQVRLAAYVMLGSAALFFGGAWISAQLGLAQRWAVIFDLVALAGFAFAIIVLFQVWRARQRQGD
ncbi:MAG: DUF5337 family protein [Paracoccaceae bacterium]